MRNLYKILLAALLTAKAFSAHAASVTIDGIKYESSDDGTYAIVSTYQSKQLTIANILPSVTIGDKDLPVAEIGEAAFHTCSVLTSVTIPNSVKTIGSYAFYSCSSLTSVTIPNSVSSIGNIAFEDCSSLISVTISNSVSSIGSRAFFGCSSLTSVTIPNSVTKIGYSAFGSCSSLTSVTIPNSVTEIGAYAFSDCSSLTSVTIPNSVTEITNSAFGNCSNLTKLIYNAENCSGIRGDTSYHWLRGCTSLTEIEIGESVKTIPEYAFLGTPIKSVNIPNSVTLIRDYAFGGCTSLTKLIYNAENCSLFSSWLYNCTSLTEIEIGESVKTISAYAFYKTPIKSVTIPNSVTSIGDYAFYGCSSLTSATIGNSVTSIGNYEFSGCSSLTSVTIGNSVTSIGDNAFRNCSSLTSVTIPSSVTSIGYSGFKNCSSLTKLIYNAENCSGDGFTSSSYDYYDHWLRGCTSLKDIEIGESVKRIPEYAFYETPIKSVTIPNSVSEIGSYAFSDCTSLKSVTIGSSVTMIGKYAFSSCTGLTKLIYNAEDCSGEGFGNYYANYSNWLSQCSSLTEVEIGESVKRIPEYAFYETNIKSVTISNSTIGDRVFYYCRSLTNIDFGNSVTEIGDYAFSGCRSLTSVTIPSSVTSIGESSFSSCSSLTSVTIPNSVTEIGSSVFGGCTGLTKLIYNAENCSGEGFTYSYYHWLSGCSSLTEIEIGESVKTIPAYAFYETTIKSATIGNCVTSIGDYAFFYCSCLSSVTIGSSVTSIGDRAFYDCSSLTSVTIPNSVTEIGNSAFRGCSSLTCVTIGHSVTEIGSFAFYGCSSLTSVTIPNSVTTIETQAFYDCSSLTSVNVSSLEAWLGIDFWTEYSNPTYYAKKLLVNGETIRRLTLPEGLTEIKRYAFVNCEPLLTVNCGSKIKNVGREIFSGCTGLQRFYFDDLKDFLQINYTSEENLLTYKNNAVIYIGDSPIDYTNIKWPESLTEIPDYAFYGQNLTNCDIPESVNSIGKYAFAKTSLTEIKLPENLERLKDATFRDCTSLTSVSLPAGLKSIGSNTFYGCTSLTSVSLPAGLQTIDKYAFENCTSLREVSFAGGLQTIGDYAFNGCTKLNQVDIEDINRWAQVEFGNTTSNPIYYAKTFKQRDMEEPIHKLDINYGDKVSDYAFYNALNLNTVRADCDEIGSRAFYGCDNVTELCINATDIKDSAFSGMTNLKAIYSLTSTPPVAPDNAFSKYSGVKLYVPKGAVSAYGNAESCWWRFLDVYGSDFSDLDKLFAPDYVDGVDDVATDDGTRVYSQNGYICVETTDASARVAVYSVNGTVLHNGVGDTRLAVAPGLYIVTVNGSSTKLAVK